MFSLDLLNGRKLQSKRAKIWILKSILKPRKPTESFWCFSYYLTKSIQENIFCYRHFETVYFLKMPNYWHFLAAIFGHFTSLMKKLMHFFDECNMCFNLKCFESFHDIGEKITWDDLQFYWDSLGHKFRHHLSCGFQ